MMDRLEKLMNGLTDMDWTWWPVLSLRPPKDQDIDNRVLLKMALFFGSLTGLAIWLIVLWRSKVFNWGSAALSLLVGWVLFFLLYKVTFAYFWNRRARRLRGE